MSRGSNESVPNPGLPIPVVTPATMETMWIDYQIEGHNGEPENRIFAEEVHMKNENAELYEWLSRFLESTPTDPDEPLPGLDKHFEITRHARWVVFVLYRALRRQGEADALAGKPDLPKVEPGSLTTLPFDKVKDVSEDGLLSKISEEVSEENLMLSLLVSHHYDKLPDEEDRVRYEVPARMALAGMYWLLKYHSMLREKKT